MKKWLLLLFISPIACAEINGLWQTETNDEGRALQVKIEACADDATKTCGNIYKLINSDENDIVGDAMIKNMVSSDGLKFTGGTIWAPDKDKTYKSKMTLNGDELEVSGCVMGGMICRSQTWKRVAE